MAPRKSPLRVAFVTSEVHPFSKTGGLADVSDALSRALAGLGVEVTVFTPLYPSVRSWLRQHEWTLERTDLPGALWIGDERHVVTVQRARAGGVHYCFIEHEGYFGRAQLYVDGTGQDHPDNVARFSFFCRAVLEFYQAHDDAPDLFHVHDWQASLLPVQLRVLYRHTPLAGAQVLLTIHNLGYQGNFPAEEIYATGLSWELFHSEALEFFGRLNLLKGGIAFSDRITTVSPSYAREIQTEPEGFGFDGFLRKHSAKLCGILNGIDINRWNPGTDPAIEATFDASDLTGKARCKAALQKRFELPARPQTFLIGVISRFDRQKGIELILEALPNLTDLDLQLVILGSGARQFEEQVQNMCAEFPDRISCRIKFDDALAHQIEAGSDAFLMPSLYEPCGLNQMYSQRYGTIPIVRAVGGLADTVHDATARRLQSGTASGFAFDTFDSDSLERTIRRAEQLFRTDPTLWRRLVANVMTIDHSWVKSARAYRRLYGDLATRR